MRRKLLPLLALIVLTLAGCAEQDNLQQPETITPAAQSGAQSAEDFIGKRIAFATGEPFDIMFEENIGSFIPVHCIYEHEAMEMVKNDRADALMLDEPMARKWVLLNPEMEIVYPSFAQYDFGAVFNGENDSLRLKFNDFLQEIKENGVHADMIKRWLDTANSPPMPEIPLSGNNGTLTFASTGEMEPFGHVVDGRAEGFDIELALRFAEYMDMDIDIQLMAWDALIPYVNSGKADFAAGLFIINEERGESVRFSEPYCSGGVVLITKRSESANIFRAEDFAGKSFAIITGSIWDTVLNENIPDAIQVHFNTSPETVMALRQGKVDATFTGRVLSERFTIIYPDLQPLLPAIHEVDQAFVFGKNNPELRESFNDFLREIHADGTYEDMTERWINTFDAPPMPEFPNVGNNGKLVFANTGNNDVFGYIQDGKPVGFEIELAHRFAQYMDMELEIQLMDFAGIIPAVQSGKVDFAGAIIAVTEERKQAVDFSDAVFNEGILVTVRKESVSIDEKPEVFRAEDFAGKTIAVHTSSVHDQIVEEHIPGALLMYVNNSIDAISALSTGRAYALVADDAQVRKLINNISGLRTLMPFITTDEFGAVVSKDKPELLEQLNEFIAQVRADGTLDDMYERWLDTAEPPPMPDIPSGNGETLNFGTTDYVDGFSYISYGELTGFDIEFVKRFAAYADMKLNISAASDHSALIMGVQTGTYDMAASLFTITEERKLTVNFTDPYYIGGSVVVVFDGVTSESAESTGFWQSLKTTVERNLIHENRWKLIVDGLQVSMVITVLSFALATLLGFAVCGLRMSKNRILNAFGNIYITVLRGTPIVVLLMITFYVIFAKSSISGVTVAVIAFGANGAAFIGEIIRTAILTVDKGQVEAARSMGFSKVGAFFTVTFPQAVRMAFPVYMSEFISLFKMTAVVGYIAIVDLTKAGDIIRSRTYDAFFPLIMVAVVYLITASIMIYLLNLINRKTNKRLQRDKI